MFKNLLVAATLAVAGLLNAFYPATAEAQTPGYYFVSICASVSTFYCPSGPNPVWFGPFESWEQCDQAWVVWNAGYFGTYPRVLSNCYQQ